MTTLRSKVIRLAHAKPALRPVLLPLLKTAGSVEDVAKAFERNGIDGAAQALYDLFYDDAEVFLDDMRGELRALGVPASAVNGINNKIFKIRELENEASMARDPDRKFFKVLADLFTGSIYANEIGGVKYREYAKYLMLDPPNHNMPVGNVTWSDLPKWMKQNGISVRDEADARAQMMDFLKRRAKPTGPRKPVKRSPPPYYD